MMYGAEYLSIINIINKLTNLFTNKTTVVFYSLLILSLECYKRSKDWELLTYHDVNEQIN